MTDSKSPPSPGREPWGVDEELGKLRIELEKEAENEKANLEKSVERAKDRLEILSCNTIKKAKDEWEDYEKQLQERGKIQEGQLDKVKTSLFEIKNKASFPQDLSDWAYKCITKPQKN